MLARLGADLLSLLDETKGKPLERAEDYTGVFVGVSRAIMAQALDSADGALSNTARLKGGRVRANLLVVGLNTSVVDLEVALITDKLGFVLEADILGLNVQRTVDGGCSGHRCLHQQELNWLHLLS